MNDSFEDRAARSRELVHPLGITLPPWYVAVYDEGVRLSEQEWPYIYGGGHNATFSPSVGLTKGSVKGYDCGSFTSKVMHAGLPELVPLPLTTSEIEKWGASGWGEYLAWWVVDGIVNEVFTEHTVIEFRKGVPAAHAFLMAHHTNGPPCGFVARGDWNPKGYHARRRP
jgi:hypothetical protein